MQNLFESLKSALQGDERLVVDGRLVKNKIIELTLAMDANLIGLLLKNAALKKHFFADVGGTYVFDKVAFQSFVSNKQFLPDSYTAFKNKIGLTADGEYLTENKEVVLSWPYKDCVLQGGQTKEEQKRNEIFWNETLAPDEIDRLLEPKVLTGFKKYDKSGAHNVKNIGREDNLIVKGNNLLVLHSLKKQYAGKVKLIYIDPPYNIGSDSFNYNDKFNHSTWLTFIQNRLHIAKQMLMDKGLIFIHIGDDELHYLKVLADGIFGRDQFIATIPRKTRSGKADVPYKLSQDFDWMIVYTKKADKAESLFQRAVSRKYYKSNDFSNDEWRLTDLTKQTSVTERPNSNFTLINPKNGNEYPVNPNRCWAITVDTVDEYIGKNKIVFPGDYEFLNIQIPAMRVFKSEEMDKKGDDFDKTYVSSDFLNKAMDELLGKMGNKKGNDEIIALFGNKAFSYPKNELLLCRIIQYCTNDNDIVCDFFGGSGTAAAVALKMNRQFILCEQMDYVEKITLNRLKKVIAGEQGGISKSVNWQGGGSFIYCELAQHNAKIIDKIEQANTSVKLVKIWREIQNADFISYKIKPKTVNENITEFKQLSLDEQKQFLIAVLDKNQLYVNYADIDDKDYQISAADKNLNQQFYGG